MFGDFCLTVLLSLVAIVKYTYRDRTPFEGNDVIGGYQGKRLLFPENMKSLIGVRKYPPTLASPPPL